MKQFDSKIRKVYTDLDASARVAAIGELARQAALRMRKGESTEDLEVEAERIKSAMPEHQIKEYNQKLHEAVEKGKREAEDLQELERIAYEAEILQHKKWLCMSLLRDLLVAKLMAVQDKEPMAREALDSLLKVGLPWYREEEGKESWQNHSDGMFQLFLSGIAEKAEIASLSPEKRAEFDAIEKELESEEMPDERFTPLWERRMALLPLSNDMESEVDTWRMFVKQEKKLLQKVQEITRKYDPEFAASLDDVHRINADLVERFSERRLEKQLR